MRVEQRCGNPHPDINKCPVPILQPDNEIAWELFQLVRGQFIVAPMGGIVGINLVAVLGVLDLYKDSLDDKIETFEKLVYLCQAETMRIQEKVEATAPKK